MTFTAKATLTGGLLIHLPKGYEGTITQLLTKAEKLHGGYITVTIGTPKRPRSTGPRSQNSKVWGMVADIAEWFTAMGSDDIDNNRIYEAMKRMAIAEGYPTRFNPVDGIEEPESQSRVSVEQDQILINVIQRFADENSIPLTDYDEQGGAVKTIGGKIVDSI